MQKGEYVRVKSVDAAANQLTIVRADGSELTYDPRRQQVFFLFRDQEKAFSVGDRIQFTAPANDLKIANRERSTSLKMVPLGPGPIGSGKVLTRHQNIGAMVFPADNV